MVKLPDPRDCRLNALAFWRTVIAALKAVPSMGRSHPRLWLRMFPTHLHLERGRLGIGRWADVYGPNRIIRPENAKSPSASIKP